MVVFPLALDAILRFAVLLPIIRVQSQVRRPNTSCWLPVQPKARKSIGELCAVLCSSVTAGNYQFHSLQRSAVQQFYDLRRAVKVPEILLTIAFSSEQTKVLLQWASVFELRVYCDGRSTLLAPNTKPTTQQKSIL